MSNILRSFYYFFISTIVLISWPLKLCAATSELYQAVVPVASYSSADFNKALGPALAQVLVKVSGNSAVANHPSIKKAFEKPDRYLQSYNYASVAPDGTAKLSLIARFSPKSVNTLLQSANQPIIAREETTLETPSQKLPQPVPSSVPVSSTPTTESDHPIQQDVIPASSGWVELSVSNIYNLNDYADVIKYFRGLRSVAAVNAAQMEGGSMALKVQLRGSRENLIQELHQGQKLVPESVEFGMDDSSSPLLYRWNDAHFSQDPYANPAVESFPVSEPDNGFAPLR